MKQILFIFLVLVCFCSCEGYRDCLSECNKLTSENVEVFTIDSLKTSMSANIVTGFGYRGYTHIYSYGSRGGVGYYQRYENTPKTKLWLSNGKTHDLDYVMTDVSAKVYKAPLYSAQYNFGEKKWYPIFVGYNHVVKR